MLLAHGSSMPKLGYFVILQTEIMPFGISRNIKYYQEVWKNLSVEILWQFLTAGHSVYLRPWPAVPQLVVSITKQFFAVYTTDTSSINWSNVKPKYFLGSLYISKETPNTFNRSDWNSVNISDCRDSVYLRLWPAVGLRPLWFRCTHKLTEFVHYKSIIILESLGCSKQTSHFLIRFKRSFP